jgi:N utilization substance protein B
VSELGEQRHRARQRALEIAYEASIKDRSIDSVIAELASAPDAYTVAVLTSFAEHRDWAQALISDHAQDWQFDRMPLVDRLIMMLALCEFQLEDHPPTAVIIDEAVEIAKAYSTDGSPGFVNGVLSACFDTLR